SKADGLANNQINTVLCDADGVVWVGTPGGLSKYDEQRPGQKLVSFTTADGLIDNNINALSRDSTGGLWLATDFGVSRYDGKEFVNFGITNAPPVKFVATIDVAPDGGLWLGTFG